MENNPYLETMMKCSRCGACQAKCPVYAELKMEPYVCRGKLELLDSLKEGKVKWNDRMADIFSTCLLCGACANNCNNGVKGDKIILSARQELADEHGVGFAKKSIFHLLLKYPGRLNFAGKCAYIYERGGLRTLAHKTKVLSLLPGSMGEMEKMLPDFNSRSFRKKVGNKVSPKGGEPKLRVAYFTGCMTNLVNERIGQAIIDILVANRVEVLLPEQYCCGVPAWASGDYHTARELAAKNVTNFRNLPVDYIITDCASCYSTWLDYPELLQDDSLKELTAKFIDINRFLVDVLDIHFDLPDDGKEPVKVTYHDSCHLKRTERGREAPRELLRRLAPRYEFVEMDLADRCCGSAGSFNITHYDLSQKVGAHKLDSMLRSGATILTAACPSCLMQLSHILREHKELSARHTVELAYECFKEEEERKAARMTQVRLAQEKRAQAQKNGPAHVKKSVAKKAEAKRKAEVKKYGLIEAKKRSKSR